MTRKEYTPFTFENTEWCAQFLRNPLKLQRKYYVPLNYLPRFHVLERVNYLDYPMDFSFSFFLFFNVSFWWNYKHLFFLLLK